MSPDERQEILLEAYEQAARDLAEELERQVGRLSELLPAVEHGLRALRRHTAELEARLAA
jgi:hypothetical protein